MHDRCLDRTGQADRRGYWVRVFCRGPHVEDPQYSKEADCNRNPDDDSERLHYRAFRPAAINPTPRS